MAANAVHAIGPRPPRRLLLAMMVFLTSRTRAVDAFFTTSSPSIARPSPVIGIRCGRLQLARKYIVIGGNIDGINPNQDEDTYNMSKKERRRREREAGAANFKSGNYKKKKNKSTAIDYDKLEEKVTRERTPLPRESRETTSARRKDKAEKKLSAKAARLRKQRTAGGTVNSAAETAASQSPETQAVQIRVAKRGNKVVTMVQGMTLPFKDRKALLREMKGKLGGGGALVEGVLELQGSHSDKVLDILRSKGYSGARVVGGK